MAWLGNLKVGDKESTAVMGIINLDPHSFYQDSYFKNDKQALSAVEEMIAAEVDIIDVGGSSTAPGSPLISPEHEAKRVLKIIKAVRRQWDIPISIDTQRARIAEAAISLGASIVNDVSGLKFDSNMANIISENNASCVLMACQDKPGDGTTINQILKALKESLVIAKKAEIPLEKIVVDPGIGFGKAPECDLNILRNLQSLRVLNHPILIGVSRKSFIGHVLGYALPQDRLAGTLSAVTMAILGGAHVIRAHDIRETQDCIKMVNAVHSVNECE